MADPWPGSRGNGELVHPGHAPLCCWTNGWFTAGVPQAPCPEQGGGQRPSPTWAPTAAQRGSRQLGHGAPLGSWRWQLQGITTPSGAPNICQQQVGTDEGPDRLLPTRKPLCKHVLTPGQGETPADESCHPVSPLRQGTSVAVKSGIQT